MKKIFTIDNFIEAYYFTGILGCFMMVLFPINMPNGDFLIISFLLAFFYYKIQSSQTKLENKIFELKELIENGNKAN